MRTIAALLMLLVSIPLLATPSTLVAIPSTDIQPAGIWHLGADSVVFTNADGAFVDMGLTYGVTPRLELGVDLVSGAADPLLLNGKYLLLSADQSPVPVAVGIFNAASSDATGQNVAYAVGSTTLANTRLTFGGYKADEDLFGDDDTGLLFGLDRTMGPWWFGADYISGDNLLGSWNVGVGYALTDKIGVIVGYDKFNDPDAAGADAAFNIQFDVNL